MAAGRTSDDDRNDRFRIAMRAELDKLLDAVAGDVNAYGTISLEVPFEKGYFQSVKAGMHKRIFPSSP
jgi:hypothetical protein